MSYAKKNLRRVTLSIAGLIIFAAIAVWQFYLFVSFEGAGGGSGHLWLSISMAVLACAVAFLVFSVFVRHDTDDELHITSIRNA